jgi:hypothetical protein
MDGLARICIRVPAETSAKPDAPVAHFPARHLRVQSAADSEFRGRRAVRRVPF